MWRDPGSLLHILNAARLVRLGVMGVTKEQFEADWMRSSAVMRQMEIIGEAAKRISNNFKRQHPEIPWRDMAGMRDVLIHAYDDVNMDKVWDAIQNSVPTLIETIEPLVPPEEPDGFE